MRVLFLNRSYFPDVEATGQLLTELCEDLSNRFDIHVIAGQPNLNAESVGYRRYGIDRHAGVTIHRVWHTRFAKRSYVGRIANQITFFLAASMAALAVPRPDVVVVATDPPFLGLLGRLLAWRFNCRLIAYLQDIYPDIAVALGKLPKGFPTNVLRCLLHAVYRAADQVIVLSEDMRLTLERLGVDDTRISVIHNWSDTSCIRPVPRDQNQFRLKHSLQHHFVVMYSGNMGLSQRLDEVLHAAGQLKDREDIAFVFVGGGAARPDLERLATGKKLHNVRFLDYQSRSQLSHSLSAADMHLIPFDERVVPYLMPSKLYGILAAGRPVVAISPSDCELSRIVQSNRIGFVTSPGDPTVLAALIRHVADHQDELIGLGENSRRLAVHTFDRRCSTGRIGELLERSESIEMSGATRP